MILTKHARERLESRLSEFVGENDVIKACNSIPDCKDYATVQVKKLERFIVINESDDLQNCSKGDSIVAVCRFGKVVTVMLRKSYSISDSYK